MDSFRVVSVPLYDWVEDATATPAAAGSHGECAIFPGSTFSGSGSITEEDTEEDVGSLGAIGNVRGVVSREDAI